MRLAFSLGGILLGLLAAGASAAPKATAKAAFYVAVNGNDSWSGHLPAPNRARTDGPFATPDRARLAVRSWKAAHPEQPVTVLLRGGLYSFDKTLVFGPEDSGTAAAPVVYADYPGETPVLSGGVRLSGWTVGPDGRWTLSIPAVKEGAWTFSQLFADGQRRYRPRLPRTGYFAIADAAPPTPEAQGKGQNRFRFKPGDIRADWANLSDVEVLAYHNWSMSRLPIASVDAATDTVTLRGRTWHPDMASLAGGNRYAVENVKEALGKPGDFYLDRPTGTLIYIPMPGEEPERTAVIAPKLEQVVRMQGDEAGRKWVEHITFRGLTFAHTNWTLPANGYSQPQAESGLHGAILAEGARHCAFEGCTVTHTGQYGMELGRACRDDRVDRCTLTDLAAGGIKIGETEMRDDPEAFGGYVTVRNCRIMHGGRMHPAGVGVWIGQSPYNVIEHNEIGDLNYTGVSVGWSWGYGPSGAHHNTVAYNHIHDIGHGVLSDMGGIYTLGLSPGSVLRGNVIHDVESATYGGWGIYFDEGTTGMLAEDNIVYRTKTGGFHQHYGKENVVRNNIFALAREGQIIRTRAEEHLSFTFERNIVYWTQGPLLGSNWSGNNYRFDHNLYWNPNDPAPSFAGMSFAAWQAKRQDVHSLIADPLFMDPEHGDFRLKPGSPASKIGFVPLDARKAGVMR